MHQTFPTKRWEAQFRRNGKPTSLGCFDNEEEAARAYDKMMIWCEIHHATGVKGGITNFDQGEYQADIPLLQEVTQVWLCDRLAGAWCDGCRSGDKGSYYLSQARCGHSDSLNPLIHSIHRMSWSRYCDQMGAGRLPRGCSSKSETHKGRTAATARSAAPWTPSDAVTPQTG